MTLILHPRLKDPERTPDLERCPLTHVAWAPLSNGHRLFTQCEASREIRVEKAAVKTWGCFEPGDGLRHWCVMSTDMSSSVLTMVW